MALAVIGYSDLIKHLQPAWLDVFADVCDAAMDSPTACFVSEINHRNPFADAFLEGFVDDPALGCGAEWWFVLVHGQCVFGVALSYGVRARTIGKRNFECS